MLYHARHKISQSNEKPLIKCSKNLGGKYCGDKKTFFLIKACAGHRWKKSWITSSTYVALCTNVWNRLFQFYINFTSYHWYFNNCLILWFCNLQSVFPTNASILLRFHMVKSVQIRSFFAVCIFMYSHWIQKNPDHKKLRI